MSDPYRRWDDAETVTRFAAKGAGDFFRTETRFLDEIAGEVASVLDIGCASGRLLELFRAYGVAPDYTGIDVSAAQIESARRQYPGAVFHAGNALELEPGGVYDLVNATGVMQHEPRFMALIGRMIGWSRCRVLFDVKLARLEADIVDMSRARAGTADHPLFFNLLAAGAFLDRLAALDGIGHAQVFGYATPTHRNVVLPPEVDMVVSAGVLLTRGEGPVRVTAELPAEVL